MHKWLRKTFILAASLMLVALLVVPAMAQNRVIRGKVTDEGGQPVVGAEVKILGVDVKREYKVPTEKKGDYFYMGLPTGVYRVVVRAKGFQPDFKENIRPALGGESVVDFQLKPGDPTMKLPFEMSPQELEKLKQDYQKAQNAQKASGEVKGAFDAGLKLAAEGKFEEALVEYKKALEKDPDQAYIQANLADALAKLGKNDDALAAYQKALSLKPDDAALYTNCGVLLGKWASWLNLRRCSRKPPRSIRAPQPRTSTTSALRSLIRESRHKQRKLSSRQSQPIRTTRKHITSWDYACQEIRTRFLKPLKH